MAYHRLVALSAMALVLMLVVSGTRTRARAFETVSLAPESVISLATPPYIQVGKRYAFTWAGGGPAQTYVVKSLRRDGWVLVEVADENTNPALQTSNSKLTWASFGVFGVWRLRFGVRPWPI
ncbi:MAG: hypothetical protein ABIS06_19375 [Vicinamibacterales bacterium]